VLSLLPKGYGIEGAFQDIKEATAFFASSPDHEGRKAEKAAGTGAGIAEESSNEGDGEEKPESAAVLVNCLDYYRHVPLLQKEPDADLLRMLIGLRDAKEGLGIRLLMPEEKNTNQDLLIDMMSQGFLDFWFVSAISGSLLSEILHTKRNFREMEAYLGTLPPPVIPSQEGTKGNLFAGLLKGSPYVEKALGKWLGKAADKHMGERLGKAPDKHMGERLGKASDKHMGAWLGKAVDKYMGESVQPDKLKPSRHAVQEPISELGFAERPAKELGSLLQPAPKVDAGEGVSACGVSVYDESVYSIPSHDVSAYDASAYDVSAYDAPAYDESAYDIPADDIPVYGTSAYDAPAFDNDDPTEDTCIDLLSQPSKSASQFGSRARAPLATQEAADYAVDFYAAAKVAAGKMNSLFGQVLTGHGAKHSGKGAKRAKKGVGADFAHDSLLFYSEEDCMLAYALAFLTAGYLASRGGKTLLVELPGSGSRLAVTFGLRHPDKNLPGALRDYAFGERREWQDHCFNGTELYHDPRALDHTDYSKRLPKLLYFLPDSDTEGNLYPHWDGFLGSLIHWAVMAEQFSYIIYVGFGGMDNLCWKKGLVCSHKIIIFPPWPNGFNEASALEKNWKKGCLPAFDGAWGMKYIGKEVRNMNLKKHLIIPGSVKEDFIRMAAFERGAEDYSPESLRCLEILWDNLSAK
jgi:hypothetical protein